MSVEWSLKRTVEPGVSPLTLNEVKAHIRETTTDRDAEIAAWINEAESELDGPNGWLGRALIKQTLRLKMDRFPSSGPIRLPLPPLVSVTSVQYVDINGATQTWSSSLYDVLTDREPGEIRPKYGESYPSIRSTHEAVTVTYVAGYGDKHTDVPELIRSYLKLKIGDRDVNRQSVLVGAGAVAELPHVRHMLTNFEVRFAGPIRSGD